jgi:hypothetical protein
MPLFCNRIATVTLGAFAVGALGCANPLESSGVIGVSAYPVPRRAPPTFEDQDADAVRLFYDALDPYGEWSEDARLGLVWKPSSEAVGERFIPYATHGRWTYREAVSSPHTQAAQAAQAVQSANEFVWVSDLPWGWVTFHYGRWTLTRDQRWAWVPGRRYAGAWVDWRMPRERATVVGWGPAPPMHLWRVVRGPRATRTRIPLPVDPREAHLEPIPCASFAAPFVYAESAELFASDLSASLLGAHASLVASIETVPADPPSPDQLGLEKSALPEPPSLDRGLQRAWLLSSPATAIAFGAGPRLSAPPMLRTWVAGAERYVIR